MALSVGLLEIVRRVHQQPLAIKGNYARRHADAVAAAASLRLITTQIGPDEFTREWRTTVAGLLLLNEGKL